MSGDEEFIEYEFKVSKNRKKIRLTIESNAEITFQDIMGIIIQVEDETIYGSSETFN